MSSKQTSVASNPNGSFSGNHDDSKIELSKDDADKIWKYGISLDGEDAIQCKFCDEVITGGLHRFLYHLAGIEHGGEGCGDVGDEEVEDGEKGCTCVGVGEKRKRDDLVGGSSEDFFKKIEIPKDFADKILEYGISLDGEDAIQCKFCGDVITGGLHRFLYHLAGTDHGGEACGCGGGGEEEEEKGRTCVGVGKKREGDDMVGGSSEDVFKKIEMPKEFADKIWEYGISLDGEDAIQCKFCGDVIIGGIYRFLFHLTRTEHGGKGYGDDGDEEEEEEKGCFCAGLAEERKGDEICSDDKSSEDVFVFKKTIDGKEVLKEEADLAIATFFYSSGIPLKVLESKSFIAMVDMISRYGIVGWEPPSVEDLRGKYLTEEVRLTNEALEEHRSVWKKTGCSIMVDGWIDKKKRSILNLLVNSLKGTFYLKSIDASHMLESPEKLFKMMDNIVEEVGEESVVQIVTDGTPYYKAAGEMLMEKRTKLYWTPCATHCIEMMLEDYEKIPIYEEVILKGKKITTFIYSSASLITLLHEFTEGVDLVGQSITRCVTSYLALGRLYEKKEALRKMFTSKEWTSSQFAKTSDGKYAEDVVLDKVFWENVMICLNGANPLIDVLRLVNSIDEPATGFIYKAKEQAKEEIRRSLSEGGTQSFVPLLEIIDERWDKQLHSPLHAAGYFLNPQIHYRPGFRDDIKVKDGLYHCIARMVADPEERAKIETQLDDFDKQANILGHPLAVNAVGDKIPSEWWSTFGDGLPELQKFACRVLSLTCSSYGGLRGQRAFKMLVLAKKRNLSRQKTHSDVVFVMANAKLAEMKQAGGSVELNLDGNGDNEDDDEEEEDVDEDEDGDDDLKSLYDVVSYLHYQYGDVDEDEYGDVDGDEYGDEVGDEDEDGDEDQMEDSD